MRKWCAVDETLAQLVTFVRTADFATLDQRTVRAVIRHNLDAVGCGAGGFDSQPAEIARVVWGSGGELVASVYGHEERATLNAAMLANATANRYLDFNDFGPSGHPSDMMPGLLAVGEAFGRSGQDVVTAIYIAYEIANVLAELAPKARGRWDQGLFCSLGAGAGIAKLMRLTDAQTANALSLSMVPSIPLRVTRTGELSDWKAMATAHAVVQAAMACQMAKLGLTGPGAVFEGPGGLFEMVTGPLDGSKLGMGEAAVSRTSLKKYAACYWSQTAIECVLAIRDRIEDPGAITAIDVETFHAAWWTIGGGIGDVDEKWAPETRETADHSMPYIVASAFLDGRIGMDTFAPEKLRSADRRRLMQLTSVSENKEYSDAVSKGQYPTRVKVTLADGREIVELCQIPKGNNAMPMSDDEVGAKFDGLVADVLAQEDVNELRSRLWEFDQLTEIAEVTPLFRKFRRR